MDCVKVSRLVAWLDVPKYHLTIRRASGDVVHVGVEFYGLNVVEMSTLTSKYSQRLIILQNPEFCGPVSRTGDEVASEWRELDIPYRIVVPIVNHERAFSLKAPSSYSVVIGTAEKMLIANWYSHWKHGTCMTHELILLRIYFHLLKFTVGCSWLSRLLHLLILFNLFNLYLSFLLNFLLLGCGCRNWDSCSFVLFVTLF